MTSFVSITQPSHDNDGVENNDGDINDAECEDSLVPSRGLTAVGSFGGLHKEEHVAVGEHYQGVYPLDPLPITDLSMVPIGEKTSVCHSSVLLILTLILTSSYS